jgi:serine/threonine protein kinase/Tfp pilus assembly protein PilF
MSNDPHWRMKELFATALDLPPAQREQFLLESCRDDEQLLTELRQMLAAHDHAAAMATRSPKQPPTAVAESPAALIGASIGRYKLLELIGEGGMGVVYKAEQRSPVRRVVALKLIKLGMDTRQVIARFDSERQALAVMNHPNVAAVHDAGATETGRPYFVMEYVPGTPITSFCDRHRYTTRQRLELFTQACDAIQHAHTKAIIHRDIKPGNILVTMHDDDHPVVKVIDFGVAKATAQQLTEHTLFTETGQLIGTPEYMSPEQAELNPADIDTRSDIYSLGVVLYELLVGALPFDGKTLRQAAYAQIQAIIREVEPPRPSTRLSSMQGQTAARVAESRGTHVTSLQRELRSELEWIPLMAMRKDRGRRYRTASELSLDITNYLNDVPLIAGPESTRYRLGKFLRRNRATAIASATVLVVLIAGIAGTTVGLIGQSRQRIIAEQQRALAERQRIDAEQHRAIAVEQSAAAQRQETEAKRQAAIAQAVGRFQSDMLASADPDKMFGDKVTVVQAITAAEQELDAGQLKDQPLVEAAVRQTIGSTLLALGRFNDAEQQLNRALELCRKHATDGSSDSAAMIADSLEVVGELYRNQARYIAAEPLVREAFDLRRKALPPNHFDVGNSNNNLGLLLDDMGRFTEAEAHIRKALAIARENHPEGDLQQVFALNSLGLVLQHQGKLGESETAFQQAVDLAKKHLPPNHPQTALVVTNLAWALESQGKLKAAEALQREALLVTRQAFPAQHPRVAWAVSALGEVLQDQGRYSEAEPLMIEALDIRRKALSPDHPDVALAMNNLAGLYQVQGKFDLAEPLFRDALNITTKAFPPDHPAVALALNNLALLLRDRREFAQAEELFRKALVIRRKALPPDHPDFITANSNLALVLQAQDHVAEAVPLFREAIEIAHKDLPEGHPTIGVVMNNLASALLNQGKLEESETLLRQALQNDAKSLRPDHPNIGRDQNNLAECLRMEGKLEEAGKLFDSALEIARKSLPPGHPTIATTISNIGLVLRAQGRAQQAKEKLNEAAELFRKSLPPGHPQLAMATYNLGLAQRDLGENDAAETSFVAAISIWEKALPSNHPSTTKARSALADLLQAQGRFADAEALYRKVLEVRRKTMSVEDPDFVASLNSLALDLWLQGKSSDAAKLLREALAAYRPAQPDALLATLNNNLGRALLDQEEFGEAQPILAQALAMRQTILPPDHRDLAITLANLGRLLCAQQKYAQAEAMYREALPIYEKTSRGARDWPLASARVGLARALVGLQRWSDAEALLLQAEPVLANSPGAGVGSHERCRLMLIALYDAWDHAEPGLGFSAKRKHWESLIPSTTQSVTTSGHPR